MIHTLISPVRYLLSAVRGFFGRTTAAKSAPSLSADRGAGRPRYGLDYRLFAQ